MIFVHKFVPIKVIYKFLFYCNVPIEFFKIEFNNN